MYAVQPVDQSRPQIEALPAEALTDFAEAHTVLEGSPWSGPSINDSNPDGPLRTLPFGHAGLIIYLILEDQRRVDLIDVLWAG